MSTLAAHPPARPLSETKGFYQEVVDILDKERVPFLLGGAFALRHYTGVVRDTKDLDLFLKKADQERCMKTLERYGYQIEMTAPHWLTKAYKDDLFVDFIFGLANGVGYVDDEWFTRAPEGTVIERKMKIVPAEEVLWSKAFIMERDRFDGADINHILRAVGPKLDWKRILQLFGPHWRILLSHLIAYEFVYPTERHQIPREVFDELLERLRTEDHQNTNQTQLCQGTLLSRTQYEKDLVDDKFHDARIKPHGPLSPEQAAQ
jgi:hypothetical protein